MKLSVAMFILALQTSLGSIWAGSGTAVAAEGPKAIAEIASQSKCITHSWNQRGLAPRSYIQGVALVFARAVCHPDRPDVRVVSIPVDRNSNPNDALVVYADKFAAAGMRNDAAGVDTLRHTYALLIGLGMMESSGKYCEGRDVSECFTTADSAEAGPFQASYGAHTHSPVLEPLFRTYKNDQSPCLLDAFKDSLACRIVRSHNPQCPEASSDIAGTGDGADWQRLTKTCPAFATEYGAVVLRTNGGSRGEFNPIRKQQAELRPECDSMLRSVQNFVQQHQDVCSSL